MADHLDFKGVKRRKGGGFLRDSTFCCACGAKLSGAANFCTKCGADIQKAAKPSPAAQQNTNAKRPDFILAVISVFAAPTILALLFESLLKNFNVYYQWSFILSTRLCAWAILLPPVLYPLMAGAMKKSQNTGKTMWIFTLVIPLVVAAAFVCLSLFVRAPFIEFAQWVQRRMGLFDIDKRLVVMMFARVAASALPCTAYALLLWRAAKEKTLKRFWWCAPLAIIAAAIAVGYILTVGFEMGLYGLVMGFMVYGLLSLLSLSLICGKYKKGLLWAAVAVSLAVLAAATVLTLPHIISRL